MTYVLGLTGGIASGKSTVSKILKEFGAVIIDGDQVARDLQQKDSQGLKAIIKKFGQTYLLADGQLNRQKLGNLVFNDPKELKKLNQIMSPLIHQEILRRLNVAKKQHEKLVVIDIALLFEGKYAQYCTSTLTIATSFQNQLKNLMTRDHLTKQQALARIDSQMSTNQRIKLSDEVIYNDGTVEELKQKMIKWLSSKNLL